MKTDRKEYPSYMIGTWAWGAGINGSKMVFGKKCSEEELVQTFQLAYENGLTLWDTAEVYGMGNAERILGKLVNKKQDIMISTKHQPGKKYKSGEVEKALWGSLERLGVDRIDFYWLHLPYAISDNMMEMAQCVKKGLIQEIGLSNCNVAQIKKADEVLKKQGMRLAAVQNHYSLLSMDRQQEVLQYCQENDILFFGYMVLEQGALSGHYDEKNHFPLFSMRGLTFGKKKFRQIQKLIDYECVLAEKYCVDVSQIPIIWAKTRGIIPIIGLTKPQHVKALIEGRNVQLQMTEIFKLETLARESGVTCKGIWE